MSNNLNIHNTVTPIEIPILKDTGFADSIDNAFNQINSNFEILSNHDFIKGNDGGSVVYGTAKFGDIDANNLGVDITFLDKLKRCILSDKYDELKDDKNIFSRISEDTEFGMIYDVPTKNGPIPSGVKPINSFYYVFIDGRFAADVAGITDPNIIDYSAVVIYDCNENNGNGGFKKINSFPTMYYKPGVGICWNINGVKTGIPVQGRPGKNGENSKIYVVKCDEPLKTELDYTKIYKVKGIYRSEEYIELDNLDEENSEINILDYDNQTAVIATPKDLYFGTLYVDEENGLLASTNGNLSTLNILSTESVIKAFKEMTIYNSDSSENKGLKGLFIPLENEKDNKQMVHLITSSSIRNLKTYSDDLKTDVLFSGINNINNDVIYSSENRNEFGTERFLYLKLNSDCEFVCNNINNLKLATGNYLKYKLVDIVTSTEDNSFNTAAEGGSRYYGKIKVDDKEIDLNELNTCFAVSDSENNNVIYTDHLLSLPKSIKNRIDTHCIYKWKLERGYNSFDISDLSKYVSEAENGEYYYDFDNQFDTIFTDEIDLHNNSNIIWFNGLQTKIIKTSPEDSEINEFTFTYNDSGITKYIIPGWEINSKLFDVIKFISIFNNEHRIDNDCAFNINYNVNISGDKINPKKNLSVNGNINADSVNVDGEINARIINKIYTEDDVLITKGILRTNAEGDKISVIDSNRNINSNTVNTDTVNTNTVISNTVNTDTVNTNSINISIDDNSSILADAINDNSRLNVANVNEINICVDDNKSYENISDAPIINSHIPSHYNNSANIVISNQTSDSHNVYFKNTLTDSEESEAGAGVSDKLNVKITSFDSAKNFNINRLSLQDNTDSYEEFISKFAYTNTNTDEILLETNTHENNYKSSVKIDNLYSNETNYLEKSFIQKIVLTNDNDYIGLSDNSDIRISFDNDFIFNVGAYSRCYNSNWAYLSDESCLQLSVWCKFSDNDMPVRLSDNTYTYKFDSIQANGNAVLTDGFANSHGYEWKGYSKENKDLKTDYSGQWRYYTYKFKPNTIYINTKINSAIADSFKSKKDVTIYVVPEFKIKFDSQNNDYCISSIQIKRLQTSSDNTRASGIINNISPNKNVINVETTGKISYYAIKSNYSTVKTTTICNDGIVMRAGDYVFGLGYSESFIDHKNGYSQNENKEWVSDKFNDAPTPVLFYHKYDEQMYNGYVNNDNEGYAKRTNVIPLEDIFNAIKFLRTNEQLNFGL